MNMTSDDGIVMICGREDPNAGVKSEDSLIKKKNQKSRNPKNSKKRTDKPRGSRRNTEYNRTVTRQTMETQ